jgi:hypothetical protein
MKYCHQSYSNDCAKTEVFAFTANDLGSGVDFETPLSNLLLIRRRYFTSLPTSAFGESQIK